MVPKIVFQVNDTRINVLSTDPQSYPVLQMKYFSNEQMGKYLN